ncbi:hypothetical protein [Vibrio sp. Hal054]|uniref:hypothetical protein n=1 Tax=Vibrio sp. Hal054 TaxID=3035158 RepID=UPI00301BCA8B
MSIKDTKGTPTRLDTLDKPDVDLGHAEHLFNNDSTQGSRVVQTIKYSTTIEKSVVTEVSTTQHQGSVIIDGEASQFHPPIVDDTSGLPPQHPTYTPSSDVIISDDGKSVAIKKRGLFKRIVDHHIVLLDDCTFRNLRSNKPFTHIFVKGIYQDYKTLLSTTSVFDKYDYLSDHKMSVRNTMSWTGEDAIAIVEGQYTRLRWTMVLILVFWMLGLYKFTLGTLEFFAHSITGLSLISYFGMVGFQLVATTYYFAYGYHTYALNIDTFISRRDYYKALMKGKLNAWFPFLEFHNDQD